MQIREPSGWWDAWAMGLRRALERFPQVLTEMQWGSLTALGSGEERSPSFQSDFARDFMCAGLRLYTPTQGLGSKPPRQGTS